MGGRSADPQLLEASKRSHDTDDYAAADWNASSLLTLPLASSVLLGQSSWMKVAALQLDIWGAKRPATGMTPPAPPQTDARTPPGWGCFLQSQ
jgi:hypothetical protein